MRQVSEETLDAVEAARNAAKGVAPELYKCLGELQRLAQYTSFEWLRAQLPDEARRLGVN
jgi:hypothetical protein